MSAIFISHSSRDSASAAELKTWLSERGFRSLFLDFDPELGIPAGRNWERELYRQLRACQAVIVLCSEHSMQSDWCFVEITHARALGKYIFPLRIAPCEVRPPLTELQVIDAITDRPQAYERLLQGLRMAGLDDPAIWDGSRPPYPGLMAFQEADAAVFFGRDSDIRSGLDTLNRLRRFGGTRMLICVGASGSGKSSLVRAGLLPRLRQDPDTWLTLPPFRPLQRPIEEMAMALASAFAQGKPERDWKAIAADLERTAGETNPAASLRNLLRDLRQACNRREATAIITIDQFEEALVVTEQAQRFIRLVRALADDPDGQGVVLGTLRSDFLSALQSHPAVQGMLYETLSLGPLPVDGVIQVIEGPARVAGLDLAPELTQMLLADTEAEDGLPLLAFTLRELWEQDGKTGCLTVETYRGKLGGLHGSVARAAEAVLAAESLSPEQEVDLRGAFLAMARIDESGQYMRQAVQWDALPSRIHPLLERFVRARLLVAGSEGKQRVLEVAHEALFRVWERAKAWLDADRENLRLREGLRRAAREWDERGRIPELLVHRGNRLDAVEALVGQAGFPLEAVQRDYLQTCIAARKAEQEAEQRQAAARRRRVRLTIAGLATGLVLVSALGVWASMERNEAKRRLASLHWINGVNERDRNDDHLKAVHHFVQAAALAGNAADAKNAHFAAALLAGNTRLRAILQPREGIRSAAFAADRGDVITWSETGTAHRWDAQSSQQHFPAVHEGSARKLVTSPRGKWVILQSGDGATEVLDGQRGQRAAASPLAIGLPLFNESETRFAIVGHKGDVQIWDRRSDTPVTSLVHPSAVLGAALSRDGERIVTWDEQRDVRVWTADGGKKLGEIRNRSDIIGATFRADGKQVLVWGKEGPASLWNTEEARVVELTLRGAHNTTRNSNIMGAAFVGDGKQRIVTWNYGEIGVALLWSTEKGAEPERLAHTGEIRSATFNRDGSQILTWGDDGMARVWNSKDGTPLIALRHDSNVRGATFSPDETQVLTWSDDRTARVWDARDGQPLSLPMRHAGTVEGAAFSTDGRSILSWDQHAARIWRLEPDPERRVLSLRHEQAVLTATFAPEQSEVLTITDNGQLYRWRGGEKKQPALALSHGIVGATWDADRRRAVGWSMEHAVGLWSTENGQALTPPMRHDKSPLGIQGVAPSPDGSRILSWGDDHTARLWDSANGKRLALLRHPGAVSGARQSADNSRILTWGDDRVVRLWDAESQKMLLALPAHDYGVQGATLTQNKARILTWDTNGVLRFWDAGDGAAIKQISHSTGVPIRGAVFTRDESRLLVWDEESVGIWSIEGRGIPSAVRWSADDLQKAGFNADESVVVTQGGDGAVRFWESRYGYPLTVPLVLDGPVQGALLSQDEKSFLAWTQSVAKVWNVAVEYGQSGAITAPTLEMRTGTRLDRLGELEIIPTDLWKKMRDQINAAQPGK